MLRRDAKGPAPPFNAPMKRAAMYSDIIIKTMKSPKTNVLLQVVVSFVVIALAHFLSAGTISAATVSASILGK
jgi:hypothetical protein